MVVTHDWFQYILVQPHRYCHDQTISLNAKTISSIFTYYPYRSSVVEEDEA